MLAITARPMPRVGAARHGRDPLAQRQDRQGVGEHLGRLGRLGDLPDRRRAVQARSRSGSSIARNTGPRPAKRRHAASVISPPMPAGSPMVTASGGIACIPAIAQTASSTVTGTWSLGMSQPRAAAGDLGGHQVGGRVRATARYGRAAGRGRTRPSPAPGRTTTCRASRSAGTTARTASTNP